MNQYTWAGEKGMSGVGSSHRKWYANHVLLCAESSVLF